MRMKPYAPAFCLVALLSVAPAFAAGTETPLTAEMAVARALANSPELSAEHEEVKGLVTAAERVPLLSNPVLELEGTTGSPTGSPDEKSYSIALIQEVPLSATPSRRRAVARAEADVARARLADLARRLAEETGRFWLDSAIAGQRLVLARQQTAIAESVVSIARKRFEAGDLPEMEVQVADLDHCRFRLRETEQEAELLASRRQLARVLGIADAADLPPLAPVAVPPAVQVAEERLLADTFERRPDLNVQTSENKRDEALLSLARAETVPPLTIGISYSNEQSSQNSYDLSGGLLVPGKEQTRDQILGLRLSMPLPLFSRNRDEIARAAGRAAAGRHRLEAARRAVATELRTLLAQYRLALTALELHRTVLLPRAEENYKIRQEAFELGEIGTQLLLDEKRRLGEQQEAELAALNMVVETYYRLQSATNTRLYAGSSGGTQ